MLQIDIQCKKYNSNVILENVKIEISHQGLYGIVGKNGAGKTTFFNCITHLTGFQGAVSFENEKLEASQIAFLPTEPFLYEYLTVGEFYTFFSKIMNIKQEKEFTFGIDKNLLVRELSTGMRKKVYLNALLQRNYKLYIFDEPYNGLDIESVYLLRKIINQLSESHIVFVSSHILESLNNCNEIFILKDKRIQRIPPKDFPEIEKLMFF